MEEEGRNLLRSYAIALFLVILPFGATGALYGSLGIQAGY
jgi:hypothetical protein